MSGKKIERIVLVGAGGVGFWLAVALRRDRPDVELVVYDADNFAGGQGARRLPKVNNPETKKVDFLKGWVRMVMGDQPPEVIATKLTAEAFSFGQVMDETLVVDASDMGLEVRRPLWEACRKAGCQMLRVSYDGNGCVVVARGLPLSSKPGGGYTRVPTLAQSLWAGGVGAAAVERLLAGEEVGDYQMELPGGAR